MHLGGTRWAAVGDALGRVLGAQGGEVTREYYFNDAGAQIDRFVRSLIAAAKGEPAPEDGYAGGYINDIAAEVIKRRAERAVAARRRAARDVPADRRRADVRPRSSRPCTTSAPTSTCTSTRTRCTSPARSTGAVEQLKDSGHLYFADGAWWLRVHRLRRRQGPGRHQAATATPAYIAGDIAYFKDKRARGFDLCIYMLGADHHGYIGRLKAAAAAFGDDPDTVEVLIGQMVNLVRDGKPVRMSKRAGTVITLEDLVDAVGVDAARYSLIRSSVDSTLDIDLDLLPKHSADNPVYYVQYAHARVCSVLRNAADLGIDRSTTPTSTLLAHDREGELIRTLGEYPRVLRSAAELREPHRVARYLEELAGAFHKFYDAGVPGAAEGRRGGRRRWPSPGCALYRGEPPGAGQRPRPARCHRTGADVMRRTPGRPPARRRVAAGQHLRATTVRSDELNDLPPEVWPRNVAPPRRRRRCGWPASTSATSPSATARRCSSSTRTTSAPAARTTPRRSATRRWCTTRPRRSCPSRSPAGWPRRGSAWTCAAAASSRWRCAPASRPSGSPCTATTSRTAELAAAVDAGVGSIVLDSFFEIARLDAIDRGNAASVQAVMIRVTVGVEAHTHEFIATAHEDQKFGFSLASGDAAEAVRRVLKCEGLRLVGLHSHIGSQIFDAGRLRGRRAPRGRAAGRAARRARRSRCSSRSSTVDLGGGLGIAYTTDDDPPPVAAAGQAAAGDRGAGSADAAGLPVPRIAVEPGRAIVGPGTVTLYEVGTIKDVAARRRHRPAGTSASTAG